MSNKLGFIQHLTEKAGQVADKTNFNSDNPSIVVDGVGTMSLNTATKKAAEQLKQLSDQLHRDPQNITSVHHALTDGILPHLIQALHDVNAELNTPAMKRKSTINKSK